MNVNVDGMYYYDLQRNWTRKIVPHLDNQTLNAILVRDFNNYYLETLSESFRLRYWAYVAFGACHWIVNFSLCLALLAEPKQTWRIVTSDEYSTVWDGRKTLFDFNDQAFGLSASECWRRARYGKNHEILMPGEEIISLTPIPWFRNGKKLPVNTPVTLSDRHGKHRLGR